MGVQQFLPLEGQLQLWLNMPRELGLGDSYIISYNGAVITNLKENQIIFEQMLKANSRIIRL
jgi:hydroxymethylpyrimidine pyrophosphatase-like HAD family hydrolase